MRVTQEELHLLVIVGVASDPPGGSFHLTTVFFLVLGHFHSIL